MNEWSGLILALCIGAVVLLGVGAVVLFLVVRFAGALVPDWLGSLTEIFGSRDDEPTSTYRPRTTTRRPNLKSKAQALDFDAALARHRHDDTPLPADDIDVKAASINPDQFGVNPGSPISGRIMRDGRYRRVTGGTPGRERDQDFRRPEGSDPSVKPNIPPLPDNNPPIRRKRRDNRKQDEIFGGMLDEDGDGDIDF